MPLLPSSSGTASLPPSIQPSSSAEMEAWSRGSSRYQRNQEAAQTNPKTESSGKVARHPIRAAMAATRIGVSPPPRCAPMKKMPCAVPRSRSGNQRDKARATVGHAPASPAPNKARSASSERKSHAAPVNPVKTDHQITIRVSTRRLPMRSAHQPVGISNSA